MKNDTKDNSTTPLKRINIETEFNNDQTTNEYFSKNNKEIIQILHYFWF